MWSPETRRFKECFLDPFGSQTPPEGLRMLHRIVFNSLKQLMDLCENPAIRSRYEKALTTVESVWSRPTLADSDPVRLAINVIENYQMDIRNLELPPGAKFMGGLGKQRIQIVAGDSIVRTLADTGFCQGSIYRDAIPMIKRAAGE